MLIEAKDFRLATLVAQLPADQVMAEDMAGQIKDWGDLCVLSEMTEPVRALYEMCAGNVCVCEGKKGPIEDQVKRFVISQRFGLDWQRAFGLRLWYGTKAEEPIEAAVKMFYHGTMDGDEPTKPIPPFVDKGSEDHQTTQPEDIHWGLLKLFAASNDAIPAQSLLDITAPHNTVGNPIDFRLSFQLYHALAHFYPSTHDHRKVDQLTYDFAAQLEAQGEWLWSIFILLHLSSPAQRKIEIQGLLGRHAPRIPPDKARFPFSALVSNFKIPAPWIWEAKALEARSVAQDYALEIRYLQRAGNWTTAHETLCRVVGPRCVIEEDWDTLTILLEGFDEKGKDSIGDEAWRLGGGIYQDYVNVEGGEFHTKTLEGLLEVLPQLYESRKKDMGFEEGIAIGAVAGAVAELVASRSHNVSYTLRGNLSVEAHVGVV